MHHRQNRLENYKCEEKNMACLAQIKYTEVWRNGKFLCPDLEPAYQD
jgi:hypothetical protein